ncbi:MAG: NAD(P)/FAD-dependent oxidoreductase [Bermanella sp.]
MENKETYWTICLKCQGRGKINKGIRKKVKLRYQRELLQFEKNNGEGIAPVRPKGHLDTCLNCKGSGLVSSATQSLNNTSDKTLNTAPDESYPHIAIIGGGIGGVALAVACLHRQIPFTLYERDIGFNTRSQGYGLTLQQASNAIGGLGVFSLEQGVISTRHVVHTTQGKVIGDWGIRDLSPTDFKKSPKRTNVHIARQALRLALLEQLGGDSKVQWGHQLVDFKECEDGGVDLTFQVEGESKSELKHTKADLVVGADGIRSAVRRFLIGEDASPLRYLGCIVILGICPLEAIENVDTDNSQESLLDSATVFQTANGNERIYIMPYDANSVMWQLSFPMSEDAAKTLSAKGVQALKEEALSRCQWHDPIPQILAATKPAQVSGYPVYDRALLKPELLECGKQITLIGDAAHPMSPFKGQGANQALLDALALARGIKRGCRPESNWREAGIRESVLTEFEAEMLQRSASKVKDSAEAASFLHSDIVLHEGNEPRGRCLKRDGKDEA